MITDPKEKKELRDFYIKDYRIKTGIKLTVVEDNGVRPNRCVGVCKKHIMDICSGYTKIPIEEILKESRKAKVVEIRRMIMATMKYYRLGVVEIGVILNKDHTTVLDALEVHKNYCKTDIQYKERWEMFLKYCKEQIQLIKIENKRVVKL